MDNFAEDLPMQMLIHFVSGKIITLGVYISQGQVFKHLHLHVHVHFLYMYNSLHDGLNSSNERSP